MPVCIEMLINREKKFAFSKIFQIGMLKIIKMG